MKKLFFYLATILFLSSCVSMKVENMSVNNEAYVFKSSGKTVTVATIKDFNSLKFKELDFNQSLIESIKNSKIFSVKPSNADYDITAVLVHWFQPPYSFTFHSDLRVIYMIKQQDKVLFEKEIESHSIATMNDAFIGSERAIISLERAVKQNIELFIIEISKIEL
jgi:hypothetical protein